MKIALIQTDIEWNDPRTNLQKVGGLLAFSECGDGSGKSADLIVLPEMFTTGFAPDPMNVAEKNGGAETLQWMIDRARRADAAITGSVAVEDGGKYYNRMFFVRPDGTFDKYDKRHLFSFAGEDEAYTAGSERVVVEWRGWRILLQVCYDLRFPVFARNRGDYDMMVCSASWPTSRRAVWDTLLRARAIENLCWVCGVNRVGSDPSAGYSGGTYLIDYKGNVVAADKSCEQVVFAEADLEGLKEFRKKFPALADADDFELKL